MTKRSIPDIRLKLTATMCDNISYLTIRTVGTRRVVSYFSASETPLALSNMFENAAEVRFALEDARTSDDVLRAVRTSKNYSKKVEVLP